MHLYLIVILLSWLTFIGYWVFSSKGAKQTIGHTSMSGGLRIVLVLSAIIIAIVSARIHTSLYTVTPTLGWIGAALSVIGIAYAIYARRYLGKNWGMPTSVKENPELVTTGPYAYVRHPIYTGILLTMIGSLTVAGASWLLILILYFIYFIYSALQEEKLLAKTFPDVYPEYKRRTKMLIPFIF